MPTGYQGGGADGLEAAVAQARVNGDQDITLQSGSLHLDRTVDIGDRGLVGVGAFGGTKIVWDGPSGGTAISSGGGGGWGNSAKRLEGIQFAPGTAEPGTWLDFTPASVDALCQVQRLAFGRTTGPAVKVGPWVNCHWRNLRWDNPGGYAIQLTPPASQSQSSFLLEGFTYDHTRTDIPAPGFMLIDNTAKSPGVGTVKLSGGRIEVNSDWSAPQAIATIRVPDTAPPFQSVGLKLADLAFFDGTAMTSNVAVHRDSADTTQMETFVIEACRLENLSAVIGGTWWSGMTAPSLPPNGSPIFNRVEVGGYWERRHTSTTA